MKKKVSVLAIDSTELMMALEELEKDKGIKKRSNIRINRNSFSNSI